MAQYDVDLREYWRVIKKRKWIIILMTLLVSICSYGFSKIKEPRPLYKTEAAIKIDQQTDLSFIRSMGYWVQTESMDTHAYTLTSFPVLKEVAVKLGTIPANVSDEAIRNNNQYLAEIDRLKNMISTEINERTSIMLCANVDDLSGRRRCIASAKASAPSSRLYSLYSPP